MSPARSLNSYPRPNVAVDIAVLTVAPATDTLADVGRLSVLALRRDEEPHGVLPGRFIRERRTIAETIREILEHKLGLDPGDISPTLLKVFDDPHRDERAWTLSIAHAVTLPAARVLGCAAEMVPIGRSGDLAPGDLLGFDHNEIVREAVRVMRDRYETAPRSGRAAARAVHALGTTPAARGGARRAAPQGHLQPPGARAARGGVRRT